MPTTRETEIATRYRVLVEQAGELRARYTDAVADTDALTVALGQLESRIFTNMDLHDRLWDLLVVARNAENTAWKAVTDVDDAAAALAREV